MADDALSERAGPHDRAAMQEALPITVVQRCHTHSHKTQLKRVAAQDLNGDERVRVRVVTHNLNRDRMPQDAVRSTKVRRCLSSSMANLPKQGNGMLFDQPHLEFLTQCNGPISETQVKHQQATSNHADDGWNLPCCQLRHISGHGGGTTNLMAHPGDSDTEEADYDTEESDKIQSADDPHNTGQSPNSHCN